MTNQELTANLVELGAGRVFVLTDTTTIGRDAEAHVRLDDMMVAKKHAEIRRGSAGFVLHDLGSRHGTYVAGKRVVGQTVLRDGDEILVAGVRLRFDVQQPALREVPAAVTEMSPGSPTVMKRLSAWTAQILVPAAQLAGVDALTRGHEKLRALLELTRALGVEHDPATLLEGLLENIFGLVPAERGAIVVVDPRHDGTRWQVSRHRGGGRKPVAVPNTLIQEVMTQMTGVLTVDAAFDERFSRSESIASAGIQSALCVPLVYRGPSTADASPGRGEILGILYVDCQEAIGAFDDDDLEMLTSIGGQAALALKNALLVQQVHAAEIAERRRLEQVIGNMPAAVIVLDRDHKIALVNPEGERLLPALGAARVGDRLEKVGGEALPGLLARVGSTSADVAIADRIHTLNVSAGDGLTVVALRDVTEERAQRARDAHEERLALLGRVAGGIAHDFNNLLAVIVNYTDFARERGADAAEVMEDLQHVREAAQRATALTRQLLAFGRREMIRPQVVDLNAHVGSVDRMLRRTLGAGILVRTVFAASVPTIKIDPTQLEQVIANLLVNARDAMPSGGELTITTATVEVDASDARRFGDIAPGRYAELVVRDTGVGMTRDVLARIFEPFFTTKDKLHGTGLGLATVHGIVKRAAGAITVESAVSKGSVFRVLLPATTEAMAVAAPEVAPAAAPARLATILVAEDQPPVLAVIQRILGRAGYQLVTSTCGADALAAAARHEGKIDLLLTDVIMPGMSGRELADELRASRPDVKVLFVSGHVADGDREGVADEKFLAKPFTSRELLDHVRSILGHEAVASTPKA